MPSWHQLVAYLERESLHLVSRQFTKRGNKGTDAVEPSSGFESV